MYHNQIKLFGHYFDQVQLGTLAFCLAIALLAILGVVYLVLYLRRRHQPRTAHKDPAALSGYAGMNAPTGKGSGFGPAYAAPAVAVTLTRKREDAEEPEDARTR